jgi:O-antigen/teichoic acid export membrane protein
MKAILRATAVLGSASVVTIVAGLISAKFGAVLLGPAGFGRMAVLQALLTFGTLIASVGVGAGLVRLVSGALAQERDEEAFRLRRAGWLICAATGTISFLLVLLLHRPMADWLLDAPARGYELLIVAVGVLLSLAAAVQTGMLNAHQRIGDLARIQIGAAVLGLGPAVLLIAVWRENGIAWAVLVGSAVSWAVSFHYYRRSLRGQTGPELPGTAVKKEVRALLRFGLPYTASMAVGAGVLIAMPLIVANALGEAEAGLYRAATAVAVNYLSVLLASMAQDYLPRVSREAGNPQRLCQLLNDQVRFILLVGGPAILAMLALAPLIVPLLYSSRFVRAIDILEWQLLSDLLKFPLWAMSFIIMVQMKPRAFFLTELAGGTMLLLFSWLGMRYWGLAGIGAAFLMTAVLMFLAEWTILRNRIGLRWSRGNALLLTLFFLAMASIIMTRSIAGSIPASILAGLLAFATGCFTLATLWREFGGWQAFLSWRQRRQSSAAEWGQREAL